MYDGFDELQFFLIDNKRERNYFLKADNVIIDWNTGEMWIVDPF
jgi:hypothetical protein